MSKLSLLFLYISILSYGQSKRIHGSIIDTAFGKKFIPVTLCISDTTQKTDFKTCEQTDPKGNFDIEISSQLSGPPYVLRVISIGRPVKKILIYDTSSSPIKIILDNPFIKTGDIETDIRKNDTTVKLVKYSHHSQKRSTNKSGNQKKFKRKINAVSHEIQIQYAESCGLTFKPTIKFDSDTLFIQSNNHAVDILNYRVCYYRSSFIVSGLKSKNYVVQLDGEICISEE